MSFATSLRLTGLVVFLSLASAAPLSAAPSGAGGSDPATSDRPALFVRGFDPGAAGIENGARATAPTRASGPGSANGLASPAVFRGVSVRLGKRLRRRMTGNSWHRGCPVPLSRLRLLKVRHWGFDGQVHRGRLVVHADASRQMLTVMRRLFRLHFAIRRMRLVDAYGSDDHRSMNADNTSAFNCREVAGRPGVWSQHAFGRAIDVNPVENPYVSGSHVSPAKGRRFADRRPRRKGMIAGKGAVVRTFARAGWEWGGNWTGARDYQHFSTTGT